MCFLGLSLEDDVPDHSTLSRFRSELTAKKAYDQILRKVNVQLSSHKLIVRNGSAKVDASLTQSPAISSTCTSDRPYQSDTNCILNNNKGP